MTANLLEPGVDWTDRENGTLLPKPINYTVTTLNNTPGIQAYVSGAPAAGQTFGGLDATIRVAMADPVEFVQFWMTEYANYTVARVDIPYIGQEGDEHVYQLDGVAELSELFTVPPGAGSVYEIVTSAYPSQAILPINFKATYIQLVDAPAPSRCFWTDLVGVTQDCVEASEVAPIRDYRMSVDNGVAYARWTSNSDLPDSAAGTGFGIYFGGANWQVLAGVDSYFPYETDDRAVATVAIWRAPRTMTYADFNGDPDNFASWAELVDEIEIDNLSVQSSNNGGIPYKVYGPATGLPSFDPDYIYLLRTAVNIYSAGDDLVSTSELDGAVYDPSAEVPDAQGETTAIKLSVLVVPLTIEPFPIALTGIGAAYMMDDQNNVVLYAAGEWRGVLAEFTCDEFEATIDGGPLETIPVQCS